ncbi:MAG: tRNA 2-thiouridine(34) synthase MnmA [Candidatus Caenarcaniphilales bacterium]|nr:tRNA 2-thiouridine(34) synthase MnmA [Candidatus Caenarcaniphilales bacterium]
MSKIQSYLDLMLSGNHLPDPANSKIAVAMSGGVDSSVAIYILKELGYEVFGITAWLISGSGKCCDNGVVDAVKVCDQLGVEHHAVDLRQAFADGIIKDFHESYARGETPIPCISCNNDMKWGSLLQYSLENLGASHLASGHYAKLSFDESTSNFDLHRPVEAKKDQSYMLWGLNQDQLAKTIFPLADFTKEQIREIAELGDLCVANKEESQDICFVSNGMTNSEYLTKILGEKEGPIILASTGEELAKHTGSFNYTYGQRKGLKIAYKEPLYVTKIDSDANIVYVGTKEELLSQKAVGNRVNMTAKVNLDDSNSFEALTKIRYNSKPSLARVYMDSVDSDYLEVEFKEPVEAVTPGQAMVFYDPVDTAKVLGGAWIDGVSVL